MVYQHFDAMIGDVEERNSKPIVSNAGKHDQEVFLANLAKHVNPEPEMNPQEKSDNLSRLTGFGFGIGSLYLQEAFGYPFVVLRRQCQINHGAIRYHILPFSLIRVMTRIYHRQGSHVFWKGWGSTCVVKGLSIATEICICELLHIPRENGADGNERKGSWKTLCVHEVLKGVGLLLTLPFYSASLIDSVQSLSLDESRSAFTFFKDASHRMIGWYTSRGHGRLLPIYALVLPSVFCGILRYTVKSLFSYVLTRLSTEQNAIDENTNKRNMKKLYYGELMSTLISSFLTDVVMYPLETCVTRLHLQGTRTIIDDTDNGISVVPLCTNYDGLSDCLGTVTRQEGIQGFYKGFGALILQYVVQLTIVKLTRPFYFN